MTLSTRKAYYSLGDDAYRATCNDNALPYDFENMDYLDFLRARRVLMSSMIKDAFARL